jgi:hypothetical protein
MQSAAPVGCGDAAEIRVMEPADLFVSHGSPMTDLQGRAAGAFMRARSMG